PQELVARLAETLAPCGAPLRRGQRAEIGEDRVYRLQLTPARARLERRRLRHLPEPGVQRLEALQVRLLERRSMLLGLLASLLQALPGGREPALEGVVVPVLARPPPALQRSPRLHRRQRRGVGECLRFLDHPLELRAQCVRRDPALVARRA